GEALISFLDEAGMPGIVERAFVVPPRSQVGAITTEQRNQIIKESLLYGRYEKPVDRESAYEILKERADAIKEVEEDEKKAKEVSRARKGNSRSDSMLTAFLKSMLRAIGSTIGRLFSKDLFDILLGSKKGRR